MLAAMKHLSAGDWAAALGLIANPWAGAGAAALGFRLGRWLCRQSRLNRRLEVFRVTPLLKRAITVPSLPTRNFKFHHITGGIHLIKGVGLCGVPLACTLSNSSKSAP